MSHVDNIVIGKPLVSLEALGILDEENTVQLDRSELFLPSLLKQVGLFDSTSQIRQIDKQRMSSNKIKDPLERNLWRTLDGFEFTRFKVGKKIFWLIVGE